MNSRPKQPKYARNKNILVIGGSGSGKTRFFVKPNLMQMHSSYVVTDPKGTVLVECGKIPNSSTFSATRQMTFTTDGFPSMFAVCWMSLRTSVKSRSLISSSPPSAAGKSRRQSSYSPSLSSRPSTRMRRTPSRATVTAHFSSAARRNPRSRKSARCWARRQSTFTTPQKPVPTTTPTA